VPNDLTIPTVAPTEGPCADTLLCMGCEFSVDFFGRVACGLLWFVSFLLSFWVG
jgi:hypothetical protein